MKKILTAALFLIIAGNAYPDLTKDLIVGISKGKLKDVQKIVEKGANVNDHLYRDRTPLHWAVLRADIKIASYLISKGADVNARDKNLVTPLEYCSLLKNLDMVKLLVMKGADVNLYDKYGWTAMHYFTFYDDDLGVKYLIVQGASITNRSFQSFMDINEKSTPLDIAVKKDYSNIITTLLNPDKYLRLSNRPILTVACEKNLGPDNVLMSPKKGSLSFSIENKGGSESVDLSIEIEGVSNYDGVSFDNPPVFNVGSGEKYDFTLNVEAQRDVKEGTALFRFYAHETNSFIKSDPIMIEIPKRPALPPLFQLTAELPENNAGFHARLSNLIRVNLQNKGKGYSENNDIKILAKTGCEEISFTPGISNIDIGPDETKTFELTAEASDNLKDGNAEFLIIAEDNDFLISATNLVAAATFHLPRPSLKAYFQINTSLNTNFIIRVDNDGEAAASNLELDLRVFDGGNNSANTNELQLFHYSIKEIGTNDYMLLKLPSVLTNYLDFDNYIWNLSGYDGEKLSSISTNLGSDTAKN